MDGNTLQTLSTPVADRALDNFKTGQRLLGFAQYATRGLECAKRILWHTRSFCFCLANTGNLLRFRGQRWRLYRWLTSEQIAAKTNGYDRAVIPLDCNHLTMFVDVQQKALYWLLAAWDGSFNGYVLDYGTWPDQQRVYFTLRDIQKTLATAIPNSGLEGAIYGGLEKLCDERLNRSYYREDGVEMRVNQCLIDSNWGQSTDVVYQFCRNLFFSTTRQKYLHLTICSDTTYKTNCVFIV
jgi:hypothetical protein